MEKPAILGGTPVRNEFLPVLRPNISREEVESVSETILTGWLTTGPKVQDFQEEISKYVGARYAVSTHSCTAALHLALLAFDVRDGDEVITTPYTFVSTSNVILYQRAKPVFVDIDPKTCNIDPEKIEEKISSKTKAIIPVHFAGQPCDMDRIMEIAEDHNLYVIEDAAHALGSKYKGKMIGSIGDVTCFSFYATKNITTGEGGMLTTELEEIAEKARRLCLHGMDKDAWKRYSSVGNWFYDITCLGFKYNMTDIQAAMGLVQLRKLEKFIRKKEKLARLYNKKLKAVPGIKTPFVKKDVRHSWHLYTIRVNEKEFGLSRNELIKALKAENIGTSVHFIPVHLFSYYRKTFGYKEGDFPVSERVFREILTLPLYASMTKEDVFDVVEAIHKIADYYGK